jgi:precorrin-6B methylase 1
MAGITTPVAIGVGPIADLAMEDLTVDALPSAVVVAGLLQVVEVVAEREGEETSPSISDLKILIDVVD